MEPEIRVFRLGPSWLSEVRRRHAIGASMAAVILLFCALMVQLAPASVRSSSNLGLAVVTVVVAFIGIRALQRIPRQHATYGIALGPDVIRQVSATAPPVEMTRQEVVRVLEWPGGLALQADAPPRLIYVPRSLEGYATAREALAGWKPPEQHGSQRSPIAAVFMGYLVFLGGLMVGGLSKSLPWAAFGTVLALVLGGIGFVRILRERHTNAGFRWITLAVLAFGMLALVARWTVRLLVGALS